MLSNLLVPKLVSDKTDIGMPGSHKKRGQYKIQENEKRCQILIPNVSILDKS